jgi:hypothetical protein
VNFDEQQEVDEEVVLIPLVKTERLVCGCVKTICKEVVQVL